MSRASVLLAALGAEPTSTDDLYTRVGYPALARIGLISYPAFREELGKLAAAGRVEAQVGRDGSTLWTRVGAPPVSNTAPSDADPTAAA